MRLKIGIDELQKVVKQTIVEEKAINALKAEIARAFGPVVITEGRIEEVAAAVNDRLDVLDRTGRLGQIEFKPSVAAGWLDHSHPEVRKFASRVVPEKFLGKMINDRNPDVRAAVAARLSLPAVREMMKRFPQDDQLRTIFKMKKKLHEAGLPKPEVKPLGHDPVDGAERMGDLARTQPGPELSEAWYDQHALKFLHDYGRNIEYAWEELAVRRFASSMKATSGVEIDEAKLLKSIKGLIKDKEDNAMERNALKETLGWLKGLEEQELLEEGKLPELDEEVDPVADLVSGGLRGTSVGGFSTDQYIEQAKKLFKVQEAMMPLGMRKYRLGEGNARQVLVPVIGMLPHQHGFRVIDERALDAFCEAWTRRQALDGEPLRLEWTTHPTDVNKVGFTCILK